MTTSRRQRTTGLILLVLLIISLPFILYYFRNFYTSSWQDYKSWYPRFYFILFPVVKMVPIIVIGILMFLLRDMVHGFFRALTRISFMLAPMSEFLKTIFKKYGASVLILLVTLGITLPLCEYFLLKKGFKPGYRMYSIYFHPVDSLYNIEGFYADSNGIFCVSRSAREFVANELKIKNSPSELTPYAENQVPEIYSLARDFLVLRDSSYHSEFKTFIKKINLSGDTADREFFEAVQLYVKSPINSNGFKSIEFKKYISKRKRVLLIGDSFAWGHSTSNKTNSFADLLLAKGYIVYNTGISGTDPGQYLQIAKFLIPQLEPDFVVVNFFMGNDIQYFNREPKPYMPVFYSTNAGNLVSCPEGVYLNSPEEAYDYTRSVFTIPTESNRFNKFCAKTAFGTLLWRALTEIGLTDVTIPKFMEYTRKTKQAATQKPYSDEKLRQIRAITQQYQGKFLLVAIPELKGNKFIFPTEYEELFDGLAYFVPPVKKEDYNSYDGHFNDLGHAMHANFIDSLIRSN